MRPSRACCIFLGFNRSGVRVPTCAWQVFDLDHVQFVRDLLAIVSASVPGGDGGVVEAATRMGTDFFQQILVRQEVLFFIIFARLQAKYGANRG